MSSMKKVRRGEVWLVGFPFTDLSSTKVRPAIIWSVFGEDVIMVGIFSKVPKGSLPKTWVLVKAESPEFARTGLAKASVIKAEKLALIHSGILRRKLGSLSPSLMQKVANALKKALHL